MRIKFEAHFVFVSINAFRFSQPSRFVLRDLDVKKNLKDDLFLAVTESKKVQPKNGMQVSFEKHKIFLYKEDFDKFMDGMNDVISYIKRCRADERPEETMSDEGRQESDSDEIKLNIEF